MAEEKVDDIGSRLESSPKKSLRLLDLQCGLEKSTAHVATTYKLLKLRP
jgi:hypothetical protein